MLYQLSYAGRFGMERETGIEPATNSLEGCDSTIELLPLMFLFYTVTVDIHTTSIPFGGAPATPLFADLPEMPSGR